LLADTVIRDVRFPTFPSIDDVVAKVLPLPTAAAQADAAREAARREGLLSGQEEGRAAALADWAPRLSTLAAALEQAIATAHAERERLAAEISEVVPHVAVLLARKVIERELADVEAAVRSAIQSVTRRLADGGVVAVRVAPDIAEALDAWRRDGDGPTALGGITIHADEALNRGDWIIESDGGFLDGRLATQLEEAGCLLREAAA
jgi:flagellar assembly protein FliH